MLSVRFLEEMEEDKLRFAVIVTQYQNKWVFCRKRGADTWELPGGHRESGETIEKTARRELWEETGAASYRLQQLCRYAVEQTTAFGTRETGYGALFVALVNRFDPLPNYEMEEIRGFDTLPSKLTHPQVQPVLFEWASRKLQSVFADLI